MYWELRLEKSRSCNGFEERKAAKTEIGGTLSGEQRYSSGVGDEQSEVRPSWRQTLLYRWTVRTAAWSIEGRP